MLVRCALEGQLDCHIRGVERMVSRQCREDWLPAVDMHSNCATVRLRMIASIRRPCDKLLTRV